MNVDDTKLNMSYEEAIAELETIVKTLESGEHTLDQMLAYYERGRELADFCSKLLNQAELRVRKVNGAMIEDLSLD